MEGSVTPLSCAQGMPISGEYIKERIKEGAGLESWQPGEECSGNGRSAELKGD